MWPHPYDVFEASPYEIFVNKQNFSKITKMIKNYQFLGRPFPHNYEVCKSGVPLYTEHTCPSLDALVPGPLHLCSFSKNCTSEIG